MFRISLIALFSLSCVSSLHAAVIYPTNTPAAETPGGSFQTYFDNMYTTTQCDIGGQVVGGFSIMGVPNCVTPVASGLFFAGQTSGDTIRFNGTDWIRNNRLYNNGTNIGINTTSPSTRLDVNGTVRIRGGNPGNGKFLVSDNGGTASWTDIIPATSFSITGSVLGSTLYYDGSDWIANTNIFNAGTNVGIGTATPGAKLEVAGQMKITGGGFGSGKFLVSDAVGLASWTDNIAATSFSISGAVLGSTLYYNGANWIANKNLYNTGGNIGIGTDTPEAKLHINGNGIFGGSAPNNIGISPLNLINSAGGTLRTQLSLINTGGGGGAGSAIDFFTYDVSGGTDPGLRIGGVDNNYSADFVLSTKNPGAAANALVERFRITNVGDVGVGTNNPQAKLDINGQIKIAGGAPASGKFLVSDATGLASWTDIVPATSFAISGSTLGSTLYYDGSSWIATTNLYNTGGNIGIGTPSPSTSLDINGQLRIRGGSPGVGKILTSNASGLASWMDGFSGSVTASGIVGPAGSENYVSKFGPSGNGLLVSRIFDNGNQVGIGTTSIAGNEAFSISSPYTANWSSVAGLYAPGNTAIGNATQMRFGVNANANNAAEWRYMYAGGDGSNQNRIDFSFYGNGGAMLSYRADGNVGIGTQNPSTRLHVNGQIRIDGGSPGAGKILTSDASGLASWSNGFSGTVTASGITGGTQNYIPKFGPGGNGLVNSLLYEAGGYMAIGSTTPTSRFEIWDGTVSYFHMRGSDNIGIGTSTVRYQTSGGGNVGVGNNSLRTLTTGYNNTAFGDRVLYGNTSGYFNSALGSQALYSSSAGNWNVGLGTQALWTSTNGSYNIALGGQALYSNVSNDNNIGIGYQALRATVANNNIGIGSNAGSNITSGSNNIIIGNSVSALSNTTSNQLNIGNWIYGADGKISLGRTTMSSGAYRLDVASGFVNSASGYCINGSCIPNWSGIFDAINGQGNYLPKWNASGTGLVASRISDNGLDIAISSGALQQVLITPSNQDQYQQVLLSSGGVLKKGLTTREKLRIFANADYGNSGDSVTIQQLCIDQSNSSSCRSNNSQLPITNVPDFNTIDPKSYMGGIGEYVMATNSRPGYFISYYTGTYMVVTSYTFSTDSFSTTDDGCNVFPYYSLYDAAGDLPPVRRRDTNPPNILTVSSDSAISNVYSSTNLSLPRYKNTRVGSQFTSNVFMTPGQVLLMTIGVQSCSSRNDRDMALVINNQKKMTLSIAEL